MEQARQEQLQEALAGRSEASTPTASSPMAALNALVQSESPSALEKRPSAHLEGVQARREALEQARQRKLQAALVKKTAPSREDAIRELEEQLASGTCSAAAAAGLKKRLAALKAEAARAARAAAKASAPPEPEVAGSGATVAATVAATQGPSQSEGRCDPLARDADVQRVAEVPDDQWWPQGAPPRYRSEPATGGGQTPHADQQHRRQPVAAKLGAASAPWANDHSNSEFSAVLCGDQG